MGEVERGIESKAPLGEEFSNGSLMRRAWKVSRTDVGSWGRAGMGSGIWSELWRCSEGSEGTERFKSAVKKCARRSVNILKLYFKDR